MRLVLGLAALTTVTNAQQRDTTRLSDLSARAIPREVMEEIARVYNAAGTLRIAGSFDIERGRTIDSDVAALDGPLTIGGHVRGRVVAVNASVFLEPGARIDKDLLVVGGRVEGREEATVVGDIRIYAATVSYARDGNLLVVREEGEEDADARWWRRRQRWGKTTWSDIRLVSARTYNRVEGLPVLVGPSLGRDLGWGRLRLDALGVVRTVGRFERAEHTFGHDVKLEFELGENHGMRFSGRLFDVIDPVEDWQLSGGEVGLATFFLHRDYRDYFSRHGGALSAALFLTRSADITLSFSDERWATRGTRDPFTLFRNNQGWRPNPAVDDAQLHLLNATLRFDTRNDASDPWSGWYVTADMERGRGVVTTPGPASFATRTQASGSMDYARGFLDIRRYNRLSPDGQFNVRVVLGGWLGGDALPLQRRLSLGGPGSLPGYDFRRAPDGADVLTCSSVDAALPGSGSGAAGIAGSPAQCDRIALAQVEFRGDIRFDPLGWVDADWRPWRTGYGRGAQWVLFADAGRGWLVTPAIDVADLTYPRDKFPKARTFLTDVGLGLVLDDVGFYVAQALSHGSAPVNFFVRLKPRF
ncbi:MAG: BamA/TamA family outer membrane protein [Gemmatimonadaceae bacterium]